MKPRILIFSYAYAPLVGGAEVAVKEITDRLADRFEFVMVTVRPSGAARHEQIGAIAVHRVGWHTSGSGRISRVADRFGKFLFPLFAAAKGSSLHRKRPFTGAWSIMAAYAGLAALGFHVRHPSVPYALTLQEGDPVSHIRKRMGLARPLFRLVFSRAARVHAISNFLARFAKEEGARAEPVVIGNGVALAAFSAPLPRTEREARRAHWGLTVGDVVLVTASRLVRKNAVDTIIAALDHLPDRVKLVIAGEGPEESRLREQARDLGILPQVRFLGNVSHTELPSVLASSDVFVRPSRSEGFGNSFIEAMAAGVPVVATAAGGIPDFLTDRVTGIVCAVDNPTDLAARIQSLLADSALRDRIVSTARALVAERYDWSTIARRVGTEVLSFPTR